MPTNRMEARCLKCRSWQLLNNETMTGECRIAPPVVLPSLVGDAVSRAFPPTRSDDWCDQFSAQSRLKIPTEPRKKKRQNSEAIEDAASTGWAPNSLQPNA